MSPDSTIQSICASRNASSRLTGEIEGDGGGLAGIEISPAESRRAR